MLRASLVDEYHLLIAGGDKPYLPGKVRLNPELLDERTFDNGMIPVPYRTKG